MGRYSRLLRPARAPAQARERDARAPRPRAHRPQPRRRAQAHVVLAPARLALRRRAASSRPRTASRSRSTAPSASARATAWTPRPTSSSSTTRTRPWWWTPTAAPLDDVLEAAGNCPVTAIFVVGRGRGPATRSGAGARRRSAARAATPSTSGERASGHPGRDRRRRSTLAPPPRGIANSSAASTSWGSWSRWVGRHALVAGAWASRTPRPPARRAARRCPLGSAGSVVAIDADRSGEPLPSAMEEATIEARRRRPPPG